ncbi:hypothetical protein FOCC_FOCC010810 [Frankliniella occidentalis]|nr:hypothetical protein FOCC_FOCC010810 [Frankliniella occidentalis]
MNSVDLSPLGQAARSRLTSSELLIYSIRFPEQNSSKYIPKIKYLNISIRSMLQRPRLRPLQHCFLGTLPLPSARTALLLCCFLKTVPSCNAAFVT